MSDTKYFNLMRQHSRSQVERLVHIDFRLYFLGELGRTDVTSRFGTASAAATRDIALYRDIAPNNLDFDGSAKLYRPSAAFKPVFDHPPTRALTALSQGFGGGIILESQSLVPCEFPLSLCMPRVEVLAPLSRAIHTRRPVLLRYCSITSGFTEREVVPFALVDSGLRWHTRAFDRKSQTFRDFVLTRIADIRVLDADEVGDNESPEHDLQWSRVIELDLLPHPTHERPEVVHMDYGIENEALRVRVRAATAGYMLRRWNVDCSPDHRLIGPEYALWLRDPLALYGAETALLAPGYQDPRRSADEALPQL